MDSVVAGDLIPGIVTATGLHKSYLDAARIHQPLGRTLNATLRKSNQKSLDSGDRPDRLHRLPIPPIIVSSIEEFSLPCLLGQGVLIRTMTGDAAMASIAEAAFIRLGGLCGLLECVLAALEYSLFHPDDADTSEWSMA